MTELLERAMAEAMKSSPEMQDAIAALILAELTDEQAWQKAFSNTDEAQWNRMSEMVRGEMQTT